MLTTPARQELLQRRLPTFAVGAFALMVLATAVVSVFAERTVAAGVAPGYLDGPGWLDALFRGDSGWYHAIASEGYSYTPGVQSPIAFFPAYPLAVHAVGLLLGSDWSTAAGWVTLLSAAGTVALFADWVRNWLPVPSGICFRVRGNRLRYTACATSAGSSRMLNGCSDSARIRS